MLKHGHYAPILSDPLECKNREVLDERKKQNIYLKLHYSVQQYVCPSGNSKCREKSANYTRRNIKMKETSRIEKSSRKKHTPLRKNVIMDHIFGKTKTHKV